MSAIKQLQAQAGAAVASTPTLIDFDVRTGLKEALQASGRYSDVRIKLDSRRGHLNLIVRGTPRYNNEATLTETAKGAGFVLGVRLVSGGPSVEATYRVTSLAGLGSKGAKAVAPAAKPVVQPKTPTLTQAIAKSSAVVQAAVQTPVYLGSEKLGDVSPTLAKQIRQLVAAETRPKVLNVELVDIQTSRKVTLTLPYDVAQAVKALAPSYSHAQYTIKSTGGLSILTEVSTNKKYVLV